MTDIGVYDIHICPMVFVFEIQVQAPLVVRMFSFIIVLFCKTQVVDYGRQLERSGWTLYALDLWPGPALTCTILHEPLFLGKPQFGCTYQFISIQWQRQ